MPVDINGHVFTFFGNAVGEKGVYSVASLYQRADNGDVFAFFASGYQRAGHDAVTGLGVSGYQRAGANALTGIGVSGYQRAENKASTVVGLTFYQKVKEQSRAFAVWSPLEADQTVTQTDAN